MLENGRSDGNVPLGPNSLCGTPPSAGGTADLTTNAAQFLDAVRSAPGLVAVLSGHIHDATAHRLVEGDRDSPVQYTTDAGCYGGYRLLDFVPAVPTPRL